MFGTKAVNMKEIGNRTKCTAKGFLDGKTAGLTRESTFKTKNMDMEFTLGLTTKNMKDTGRKENNMVLEN